MGLGSSRRRVGSGWRHGWQLQWRRSCGGGQQEGGKGAEFGGVDHAAPTNGRWQRGRAVAAGGDRGGGWRVCPSVGMCTLVARTSLHAHARVPGAQIIVAQRCWPQIRCGVRERRERGHRQRSHSSRLADALFWSCSRSQVLHALFVRCQKHRQSRRGHRGGGCPLCEAPTIHSLCRSSCLRHSGGGSAGRGRSSIGAEAGLRSAAADTSGVARRHVLLRSVLLRRVLPTCVAVHRRGRHAAVHSGWVLLVATASTCHHGTFPESLRPSGRVLPRRGSSLGLLMQQFEEERQQWTGDKTGVDEGGYARGEGVEVEWGGAWYAARSVFWAASHDCD